MELTVLEVTIAILLFVGTAGYGYSRGYKAAWAEANKRMNVIKFKLDECFDAYRDLENKIDAMEGLDND